MGHSDDKGHCTRNDLHMAMKRTPKERNRIIINSSPKQHCKNKLYKR